MTVEEKALALVNAVKAERNWPISKRIHRGVYPYGEALCRAIERHEADNARNEQRLADQAKAFSDAVKRLIETGKAYDKVAGLVRGTALDEHVKSIDALRAFILPEPDPLVEEIKKAADLIGQSITDVQAANITFYFAARGYKIERIEQ